MPEDINYTTELSPFDTVLWWFVRFLFGSTESMTEVVVTLILMVIAVCAVAFVVWKFCAWVGQTHNSIVASNH